MKKYMKYISKIENLPFFFLFFFAECPDFALYKRFFPRKTSHFAPKWSDLADLKVELLG